MGSCLVTVRMRVTKYELVLVLLVLISVGLKMQINPARTSDWNHYEHQINNLHIVGYLYPPDLPVTYYVLYGIDLIVSSPSTTILFGMALFSSLLAIPIYFLSVSLSKSKVLGLASSLIVLFQDNMYVAVRYGLAKSVLSMLLYGVFLMLLFQYGKKLDCTKEERKNSEGICGSLPNRTTLLLVAVAVAQSLTYAPGFLLLVVTFILYGLSQMRVNKQAWGFRLVIVGTLLYVSVLVTTRHFNPIYSHIAGEFALEFGLNFPRFYEAFTWLPVVVSLMVFVGVLSINYYDGRLSHFSSSVAAVGVALHLGSFVVQHGWGLRLVYLTIIPFSLCFPYLVKKKLCDPWMLAFIIVCFVAPFLSRFI